MRPVSVEPTSLLFLITMNFFDHGDIFFPSTNCLILCLKCEAIGTTVEVAQIG